jgi:hypothetical protein
LPEYRNISDQAEPPEQEKKRKNPVLCGEGLLKRGCPVKDLWHYAQDFYYEISDIFDNITNFWGEGTCQGVPNLLMLSTAKIASRKSGTMLFALIDRS